MKKHLPIVACSFALALCAAPPGAAADALAEGFARPPSESRPRTWWHWMDNNISREGITKDLEAMKRAGLGGATILDIAEFRHDKGPVKSLSPEWYEMVNWAGREADRLGLSLSFHNCPGWSSSGGPWIAPKDAMKMIEWTETVVTGGAPVRVRLPACPSPVGFSRDVAVVAFPSVPGDVYDAAAYAPVATNAHLDASLKAPPAPAGCRWVVGTKGAKGEQWLDYTFRAPVEIGTVRMSIGPQFAQYHLDNQVTCAFRVSDDGASYRTHHVSDSTQKEAETVFSFPPVRTRHLRVVFRRVGRTNAGWAAVRDVAFAPGARVPHAARKTYRSFFRNAFADIPYVPTNVQPCRADCAVDRARVQVLSGKMAPDGTLAWTPPAPGPWTVLRFMMVARRSGNHPVNPEAHGLECDKLSRAGVDAALGGMMTRIMDDARRTGVKAFKYTLVDSYEVGAQNWTDGMEKTFRARRGYAIEPYLPALTGRYVTNAEVTERFYQDFRWLVSTIYAEAYGDYFAAVCHAKGLLFENEPYVGPFDEMRLGRAADVPMGEFWHGPPDRLGTARLAGNLGDVYARRYVQTETFTSGDKAAAWTSYPEDHKVQGDAAFCAGVNRFVFHSYAHQPFDTPGPGVTMGPWGFHFNRHNTLWAFYPGWLGYLGRAQFLLQQGRGVADVLYVTRENVPVKADWRPELPFGWKGNCCGADLFMDGASVRDGRVALPSGMTYRLLALSQAEEPSPAYLRKALALAEAGAEVWLGPRPVRAFGLAGFPASDAEVARLAARLWDGFAAGAVEKRLGKGRVWRGLALADVLARLGVPPDFALDAPPSGADVKFIHRALPDRDVYFVANVAAKAGARAEGTARFRATGAVEFWNADDGSRFSVPGCRARGDGVTEVPLRLAPTESLFVVFRRGGGVPAPLLPKGEPTVAADLSEGWTVAFQAGRGAPSGEVAFPRLVRFDRSPDKGIRHFSGTATYRRTLRLDAVPARAWLDLGGVHDVARVFVNGRDCGYAWHTPFRVEVTGALRAGENAVEVQVANRWVNRLVGDEELPVEGAWERSPGHPETTRLLAAWPDWFRAGRPAPGGRLAFSTCRPYAKGDPLVPSGLEGPVRLLVRAAPTLLDVDFGAAARRVDATGAGSFHGVLPPGVSENFAGWRAAHVATEAKEEGGRRFLRFSTRPGAAGGQFAIGGFAPAFPGFFRLKVTARTQPGRSLTLGLRLNGAPYTSFSSHVFTSADWKEETWLFAVRKPRAGAVGLYFYTAAGETDLARIVLEPATEDDLAAAIPRPPKEQTDFIRHARFPLGLPCGWNLGRDCVGATCEADAREPAEDGTPVLKVASENPWELWGEAFQTGHPGEPHTLRFRYRSEAPARVTVCDEGWGRVGSQDLPASPGWRAARVVFTPKRLSEAFGLSFAGERGTFRLDGVRVHLGAGEAPPPPFPCALALAAGDGEIAAETRIQFTDEAPRLKLAARGLPPDARVRVRVADLYGRERDAATFTAAAFASGAAVFENRAFEDAPVGQFRVTAWAERSGVRLSPEEELVVTRLPRPVAWGRDAPDSPFGCHFNPQRGMVKTMKAAGVNWVRLHDAGEKVSNWYAQEPEKGKWNFHDAEVACYRDAHVKIFAQLGTAPAWATHYGDLGCARMGYFEKYLRPTNAVDWVNYVTAYVRHHERSIDEYFVWNEPWGRWWASAADIKWYDKAKAGADFAALSRLAYDAVKRVNPKIRVSGFNSTAGALGRDWSAAVLAGGGLDACDVVDWHYYTPDARGLRGEEDVTATPLAPLRAHRADLGGRRVYMSEGQGTSSGSSGVACRMSGLLKASVPWPQEEVALSARLGDMTCRYILSLLAEGNAKVFLYSAHAYTGLAKKPTFLVLVGADGFAHPALVAHAQLAQAIEGRRFVRKEDAGRAGVKYVFRGRGKEVAVFAGLSEEEVAAAAAKTRLVDLYGNPVLAARRLPGTLVYAETADAARE